ncbi:hypothetical protein B0T25DRAFT_563238 [Lasiosphaeria hispida]|uniref:Uncharacterized protein n=1 Tax=Lasiosphaeria hispida TaxID=260671 RepID=A0AAJ0HWI7_9PEZI|nr:hypothetical protein B0T25DRAFT_563238 [Lasiosphaeria hispida]
MSLMPSATRYASTGQSMLATILAAYCRPLSTIYQASIDIATSEDPRQLRQPCNFLVDAILKPVAASGGKQPAITPPPNQAAAFAIELAMTGIEGST